MDGLILIDKPKGPTSHDIVIQIRKALGCRRVGHFGTLDPLATGLLLIAVGKATRLFPYYSKKDKVYEGLIRLGLSTDTYDALGRPTSDERRNFPEKSSLIQVLKKFEGEIEQVPPSYSAKKISGRPLYKWTRLKKPLLLKPIPVVIKHLEVLAYSPPDLDFRVHCSSGTYIRSLAHDLGQELGCGAHLSALRRTEIGNVSLSAALSVETVRTLADQGKWGEFLIPLETLLPQYSKVILSDDGFARLRKGVPLDPQHVLAVFPFGPSPPPPEDEEPILRLFNREGKFVALATREKATKQLVPFLKLS